MLRIHNTVFCFWCPWSSEAKFIYSHFKGPSGPHYTNTLFKVQSLLRLKTISSFSPHSVKNKLHRFNIQWNKVNISLPQRENWGTVKKDTAHFSVPLLVNGLAHFMFAGKSRGQTTFKAENNLLILMNALETMILKVQMFEEEKLLCWQKRES